MSRRNAVRATPFSVAAAAGPVAALVVALVAALVAALVGIGAPAWAWWGDQASGSTTVGAGTLPPPTSPRCTNNLLSTPTLSWAAPAGSPAPTGYRVTVTGTGVLSGVTANATTTTTSWRFDAGLLSAVGTYTVSVRSTYRNWVSPASMSAGNVNVTLVVVGGLGAASCA